MLVSNTLSRKPETHFMYVLSLGLFDDGAIVMKHNKYGKAHPTHSGPGAALKMMSFFNLCESWFEIITHYASLTLQFGNVRAALDVVQL